MQAPPNKQNCNHKPVIVASKMCGALRSRVGQQLLDTDFRVRGLSHATVKEAEHFRIQELVKKIECHRHREALQADLQQNNVYNPFCNNSKAMIREMG